MKILVVEKCRINMTCDTNDRIAPPHWFDSAETVLFLVCRIVGSLRKTHRKQGTVLYLTNTDVTRQVRYINCCRLIRDNAKERMLTRVLRSQRQ